MRGILCAAVMLWASASQAATVGWTVVSDIEIIPAGNAASGIESVAFDSQGNIWGATGNLYQLDPLGNVTFHNYPGTGAINVVRVNSSDLVFTGSRYSGGPLTTPAEVWTFDGAFSLFGTTSLAGGSIYGMSVSPTNGDVLVTLVNGDEVGLAKFNSSGVQQWYVQNQPQSHGYGRVAYNTSGEGFFVDGKGVIYSVDETNGDLSELQNTFYDYVTDNNGFIQGFAISDAGTFFASATLTDIETPEGPVNQGRIFRLNPSTGETELMAIGNGVTASDIQIIEDSIYASRFLIAQNDVSGNLMFASLVGDTPLDQFTGPLDSQWVGFLSNQLVPEPSTGWLLVLGLFAVRKRNGKRLRNRTVDLQR